ncbi:MAG TPA: hypothetical protein PLP42_05570, partial [Acidobacteriota bacterium]|nr:hypothetical protein [Acidobacteriota bacterium]
RVTLEDGSKFKGSIDMDSTPTEKPAPHRDKAAAESQKALVETKAEPKKEDDLKRPDLGFKTNPPVARS